MRNKLSILLFLGMILGIRSYSNEINYKNEMRALISQIRERGENKIIIGNGGVDIYFDDSNINKNFANNIDGILVESVVYGYGGYNKKTPVDAQKNFLNYLIPLKKSGKEILLLEYTNSNRGKRDVKEFIEKHNFKGECASNRSLNGIYTPNKISREEDIEKIGDINNYLILLNYEKFSSLDEVIKSLSYTDFDLIIMDPFVGKEPFTKEQIEKLKIKKDGTRRKVIAYLSIGEGETYRAYWKKEWKVGAPSWIKEANKDWENNYIVEFWSEDWKEIIAGMQKTIDNSEFDGYFLDTIDSYHRFK